VAAVERGPIAAKRVFSGTLASPARFEVAARVPGRLQTVEVDLGDAVEAGQILARIEPLEYRQRFVEAKANAAVAEASLERAEQQATLAARDLDRARQLEAKGVSSPAQLDEAEAALATTKGDLAVARATRAQAEARLELARLQLGETEIKVEGPAAEREDAGSEPTRLKVARRWATPGALVEVNAPLFTLVSLSPLDCIIFVEERDYARLQPGLGAEAEVDAFPGEVFPARVARVAPVFEEGSRQARVELRIDNGQERLKPGMFVRVELVLERLEDVQIVPVSAVTSRDGVEGLFQVDDGVARWTEVELGVREGARVQVLRPKLEGPVITLGQQLVDDGTPVVVPPEDAAEAPASR